jgi:hypothetical protein
MAYEFISPAECLGDSLAKINNNAFNFDTRIINLDTNLTTAINTLSSTAVYTTPPTNPYTITASDAGKTVLTNFSVANTINLPNTLPVGSQVSVLQIGTGQTVFAATGAGNNLRHPDNFTKLYKQWSMATAIYVSANNWVLVGDLIS